MRHVRRAHEDGSALEEPVLRRLSQHLAAILFLHIELEARPDPRQRRVGESRSFPVGLRKCERFKVLPGRRIRHHASADVAFQIRECRLESTSRGHRIGGGDQFAAVVERPLQGGFDLGRRRDVAGPFHLLRGNGFVNREAVGVKGADAEAGLLTRMQQDFRGDGLKLSGVAGRRPGLVRRVGRRRRDCQGGIALPPTVKVAGGLQVKLARIGDRRPETPAIQFGVAKDFACGCGRLDDVEAAGRAGVCGSRRLGVRVIEDGHVELAIGEERAGIALLDADLQLPIYGACVGVDRAQVALFGHDIDRVADQNRRAGRGGDIIGP